MSTLTAAVLASGSSRRFGGNKLLTPVHGRPMVWYALKNGSSVRADRLLTVTNDPKIGEIASSFGYTVLSNPDHEQGQSAAIRLAAKASAGTDGLLLLVADQPFLRIETLQQLVRRWKDEPSRIYCLGTEDHFGNPAIFPSSYYSALEGLDGDRGAKGILKAYLEAVGIVSCNAASELQDIDTIEDLQKVSF